MIVVVDKENCIGCGACENTCPEVFEVIDFKSNVKVTPVPKDFEFDVMNAADLCPESAISYTE